MVRTQIQLTEKQAATLKKMAVKNRKSRAALIRQAIDQMVNAGKSGELQVRREKARAAAGRYHSGTPDLSVNHDEYLPEAFNS